MIATGVVMLFYEAIGTARYGRTFGKAWLHIRPIRTDGQALGWGRSFGRVGLYFISGFLSWFGLLDPLWCLWDENQQCLHDKAVGTLVINDEGGLDAGSAPSTQVGTNSAPATVSGPPLQASPWAPTVGPSPYAYAYWASTPARPRHNGLAIASLACSIAGLFLFALPAVAGVIFGFVSRSKIRESSGALGGSDLALAGIIVGFVVMGFWSLVIILSIVNQ